MKIKEPYRLLIAGLGGQGVSFLGKLLCFAAAHENKHASLLPHYQRKIRGGLIQASVLIAPTPVSIPFNPRYNIVLLLHPRTYQLDIPLEKEALVLDAMKLKAVEIARQAGFEQGANLVLLGALLSQVPICSDYTIAWILKQWLGRSRWPELALNLQLLESGTRLDPWKTSTT